MSSIEVERIREAAKSVGILPGDLLTMFVLNNPDFPKWSGAGRPEHHHYGDGGLIVHVREVIELSLLNNSYHNYVNPKLVFYAALYHDIGKLRDYEKVDGVWGVSKHKKEIHHISRSAIEWERCAYSFGLDQPLTEEVTHAILAHHGQRAWGSPVEPQTRLAWILHLSDALSARLDDCYYAHHS